MRIRIGMALALSGLLVASITSAARLELPGWPLSSREADGLFRAPLKAPTDSVSLARSIALAAARLQSAGYLDARIAATWQYGAEPALVVNTHAGERYRFGSIRVDGAREDSALFTPALGLREGEPADPAALTAAIERAVQHAESRGHAWAQLGVSAWQADSGRVEVHLTGGLGPRVIVDRVRIEGLVATDPGMAKRSLGRLEGRAYDPTTARAGVTRLEQLGLFRRIEYLGLEGGPDWRAGTLAYRVEEPRYNQFEAALGVQGETGVVGLAHLELGNMAGSGRAVGLQWRSRGKGLTDFDARYAEPLLFGTPLRFEAAVTQQLQDTLYTRTRWGGRLRMALSPGRRVDVAYEEEQVVQANGPVRSADLQNTTFVLERDARDDRLSPRRGTRTRLSATQIFQRERLRGLGDERRKSRASAILAEAEWHRALGNRSGLAIEVATAGRFAARRVLGEYERYALGGAATLRGHDEEAFRVDRYARTRFEWRYFVGRGGQRLALFHDQAWFETRETVPSGGDRLARGVASGLGFGMRLPAAGGLVDLDYGLAPGGGFLNGKIHLQLVTTF
ncbi:MAG: BamA/TamA family outer membrane protein [Candidatus Eisenbacteria bacterium]